MLEMEGDQKEEANKMHAKMKALCRRQVVVALLLFLLVILSTVGCGTSFLRSYRSSFQSTNEPRFNMLEWRFDLLNNKYQKVEKEDWEDDGAG